MLDRRLDIWEYFSGLTSKVTNYLIQLKVASYLANGTPYLKFKSRHGVVFSKTASMEKNAFIN